MARLASKRAQEFEMSSDATVLEELVGQNLKRAYVIVQTNFREALGEDRLSARMLSAVSLTVRNPNISQSELAKMLGIEQSGIGAMFDVLVAKNFLMRAAVLGDRRVQSLMTLLRRNRQKEAKS